MVSPSVNGVLVATCVALSLVTSLGLPPASSTVAASGTARMLVSQQRTNTVGNWLAEVRYIYHGLSIQPPQQRMQTARLRTPLFSRYFLRTVVDEKASIRFHDQTTLHINERSDVVLRSPHVTYVQKGQVAEFLTPGTNHQVDTAGAAATAIGTTFMVEQDGTTSTFIVLHGSLLVQSKLTRGLASVVVKSNQETVSIPNHAPSPPQHVDAQAAFAWTDQIPTPDLGENLALDANGGSVTDSSSERTGQGGRWSVQHINDGLLSAGWESAKGQTTNQSVTIGFFGNNPYRISQVIIDPAAAQTTSSAADLRDFEIWVSTTGTDTSSFTRVFKGACRPKNTLQIFTLPIPVLAKYVQLRALDNYGDPKYLAVTELEVVAKESSFAYPQGITVDQQGGIYVADTGNDRIVKLSRKGKQTGVWGSKGSGPGRFVLPTGVAVDRHGNIYVADSGNNRIQKLSPTGRPLAQWGSFGLGPGQFAEPEAVAVDARGDIYVAETLNRRIQELSPTGQPLGSWGHVGRAPGQFSNPTGLAIDSQRNIYVADTDNHRIQKLSPQGHVRAIWTLPIPPAGIAVSSHGDIYVTDASKSRVLALARSGKIVAAWGKYGSHRGEFFGPTGIAADAGGNIYVTDTYNNRAVKLSARGHVLGQWGVFGTISRVLGRPFGIAMDPQDNVYVTDTFNGRIQLRSPSGSVLAIWGRRGVVSRNRSLGLGEFAFPAGIAVDPEGIVYVADRNNRRIQKLTATGPVAAWGRSSSGAPQFVSPTAAAVDQQHNVYVADCGQGYSRIVKLSAAGQVLARWGSWGSGAGQFRCPDGLAVNRQGTIYVADRDNARVQALSPTGQVLSTWGSEGLLPGHFTLAGGVALDADGNVYVTDFGRLDTNRVQKFSPTGQLLAVFKTYGTEDEQFSTPTGVAVDSHGDIFVTDWSNLHITELSEAGKLLNVWE